MSYVTVLRNFLASVTPAVAVPSEVLDLADRFDALVEAGVDVVMSADSTGCCGEITVVDNERLETLKGLLDELRNLPAPQVSKAHTDVRDISLVIEVNCDDGLDDLALGDVKAILSDREEVALIDRARLSEGRVISVEVQYPSAKKYGVPKMATVSGAKEMAERFGFHCDGLTVDAKDLGDDSGTMISMTVLMPKSAVLIGADI